MNTNVTMIPVAQLHPHPDNPRKDLGDITELTASIKASASRGNGKKFPVTSETRRWTAATMQWRRSRRCRATLTALTGH